MRKRLAGTDLDFFLVLTCLSARSRDLNTLLKRTPKTLARELSPLYMFVARVLLTSLHDNFSLSTLEMTLVVPSLLPGVGRRDIRLPSLPRWHTRILDLQFFPGHFSYLECFGPAIRRLSALFIYFFIRFSMIRLIALHSVRRPNLEIVNKKKRICRFVDFAVLADHREKLKENEQKISTWSWLGKRKKLSNMKVTVIKIVIGVLGTVTKGLVQD